MYQQAGKYKENKSKSVADGLSKIQNFDKPTFQFVDNRLESVSQKKLQDKISNSKHVNGIEDFQNSEKNKVVQPKLIIQGETYDGVPLDWNTDGDVDDVLLEWIYDEEDHEFRDEVGAIVAAQRVAETRAETFETARAALPEVWQGKTNTIITPYDNEAQDSNCHGFTINGTVGTSLLPMEFLEEACEKENILVFVKGGEIAHSGILKGGKLRHLLMGVGILESDIGEDTMGYDQRFILPEQLGALKEALGMEDTTPEEDFMNLKSQIQYYKGEVNFIDEEEQTGNERMWAKRLRDMQEMEFSPENLEILKQWYEEA